MFAGINWLAVLVAGGVFFGLGALWYSVLFGRKWAQLLSIDWENPGGNMGVIFGLTLAFELLASCAMAVLIRDSGFRIRRSYSPFPLLGPWFNTQVFFVLRAV